MPTEKYAHGPEILEQAQRIGHRFGLYKNALFHTSVQEAIWDEASAHWVIRTNRHDEFTAQFLGLGTGLLQVPKLPGIPGIESFKGHSFHTSRWDYSYTGGDAKGSPMHKLSDKRIAIIGTGATSVQVVPRVARDAKELLVFQRTPSSVDVRNNQPTDPVWFKEIAQPGWQQRWMDSFVANMSPAPPTEDLIQDGWTELMHRIQNKIKELPKNQRTPKNMLDVFEDADNEKMEQIRCRIDGVVEDKDTAQQLKAWYRQLCKRPCFHDQYLPAFNKSSVQLVHTDGKGVERVTETSVVVAGRHYPVDCIVYASGFQVGFGANLSFDIIGRNGVKLTDYWSDGMRSKHGIHVHGFPNAFLVQPTQGANFVANVPTGINDSAKTIAAVVNHTLRNGYRHVDVTKHAEDSWMALLATHAGTILGNNDTCTPGYYNNEGQLDERSKKLVGYPLGAHAFFKYINDWRQSGEFDGLEFSEKGLRSRL